MDFLARMNRALSYIEEHLTGELDYGEAARLACCTASQLQRTFCFIAELPLSEYVRRRRLTLAAQELQSGNARILDLALKYGYDSPTAFTRAFQAMHGMPPKAARERGVELKSYARISFQLIVKGVTEMNYRIEEKPAFQVYGIQGEFETEGGENLQTIPDFWWEKLHNGETARLLQSAGHMCSLNAVCGYQEWEGTKVPYMLCVVKTPICDTTGFTVVDVPASTWVIFRGETHSAEEVSDAVQKLSHRAFTEWFPTADYEEVSGFDFEVYGEVMEDTERKFFEEIWIRVRPNQQ